MMKPVVLLAVLVALAVSHAYVVADEADTFAEVEDTGLYKNGTGTFPQWEDHLFWTYVKADGIWNTAQFEDVYYGNTTTVITRVVTTELGWPQNATVYVRSGGVGHNFVVMRFESAVGRGYNYLLDIFGR